ncbi:hypothetical protein CSQ96_26525 [Janthinobacterium sp. BJB412]|nr:hypothetical protein CSQ96_26525 [Janthinobacterium sp. BJB412]
MKPDRAAGPATAASAATKAAPAAAWLAGALLLAACGQAVAQYMWIDDKGIKQLSDRPPPPSVPQKRILKAPGQDKFNPTAGAAGESGADGDSPAMAAEAAAAKPAPTLGERNAAYNKRKAEAALAAQQAGEDSARKAEIAANCENARNNQRALDQGVRMSTYDKNGERGFMSEAERAEAARKNKQVLEQCK